MDKEEKLTGGQVTPAVRVGDTVRRETHPWTPIAHALLNHLEEVGFEGSPRVLGMDEQGREILGYIEGKAGYFPMDGSEPVRPDYLWSDSILAEAGQMLRGLHDATATFEIPDAAVWNKDHLDPSGQREVICHNDWTPWNSIFRDGHLKAVIDYDSAGPGRRVWDVANTAHFFVPIRNEEQCLLTGWREPPDQVHRLQVFMESYGWDDTDVLLHVIRERIEAFIELVRRQSKEGNEWASRAVREGHDRLAESDLQFLDAWVADLE